MGHSSWESSTPTPSFDMNESRPSRRPRSSMTPTPAEVSAAEAVGLTSDSEQIPVTGRRTELTPMSMSRGVPTVRAA